MIFVCTNNQIIKHKFQVNTKKHYTPYHMQTKSYRKVRLANAQRQLNSNNPGYLKNKYPHHNAVHSKKIRFPMSNILKGTSNPTLDRFDVLSKTLSNAGSGSTNPVNRFIERRKHGFDSDGVFMLNKGFQNKYPTLTRMLQKNLSGTSGLPPIKGNSIFYHFTVSERYMYA